MTTSHDPHFALKQRIEQELRGNILPFWMNHTLDLVNGGFYGAVTNDLKILNDVPRSVVLCARILWSFSSAYRAYRDEDYLETARHAFDYLTTRFWDQEHGGFYWMIDRSGKPLNDRKQSYGQGFAIYGLSEYAMALKEKGDLPAAALKWAQDTFYLLEQHALDPVYGGYVEARGRSWGEHADLRLSDKEPDAIKSMNTMLHIVEPYTNLVRAWDDPAPRQALEKALRAFLDHIVNPQTYTTHLFFDMDWTVQGSNVSFGHDIEASWLLVEAAQILRDPLLLARSKEVAVKMAEAATRALDPDGSLVYEAGPEGFSIVEKHWWAQAEAMVGFYNAAQLAESPQQKLRFTEIAFRLWDYIDENIVDRTHGDWFKRLDRSGKPIEEAGSYKAGPWDCPYHHVRACLQMIERLETQA
jgi:cellobiose epimerase